MFTGAVSLEAHRVYIFNLTPSKSAVPRDVFLKSAVMLFILI